MNLSFFIKIYNFIITTLKLKLNGVKFGSKVIGNSFYLKNLGVMKIGNKVRFQSYPNGSSHRTAISTYYNLATIIIGDNCALNGTILHCNELIKIGNNCMFGPGTILCDNDSHKVELEYSKRIEKAISKPIVIENNVWIGMNCLIMKGVTIGENSIIAAGSIITKNIPANGLYGGNPIRLIKNLSI